jgi:hypothetical protein
MVSQPKQHGHAHLKKIWPEFSRYWSVGPSMLHISLCVEVIQERLSWFQMDLRRLILETCGQASKNGQVHLQNLPHSAWGPRVTGRNDMRETSDWSGSNGYWKCLSRKSSPAVPGGWSKGSHHSGQQRGALPCTGELGRCCCALKQEGSGHLPLSKQSHLASRCCEGTGAGTVALNGDGWTAVYRPVPENSRSAPSAHAGIFMYIHPLHAYHTTHHAHPRACTMHTSHTFICTYIYMLHAHVPAQEQPSHTYHTTMHIYTTHIPHVHHT